MIVPATVSNRRSHPVRGFTIIELIITIVILAVLAAIGVPSLRELIQRSNLSSAAGELHAAVARARQEAIRRGTFVTVVPSGTGWSAGYLIFVNPLNSPGFTPTDHVGAGTSVVTAEIINQRDVSSWNQLSWPSITSDSLARRDYFTFDDTGRPRNLDGSNMKPSDPHRVRVCIDSSPCRELIVDHLGRIQIVRN